MLSTLHYRVRINIFLKTAALLVKKKKIDNNREKMFTNS